MLRCRAQTVKRARKLRRAMSLPEVLIWQALRSRPNGIKFRRQHPAGPFVLDFFCLDARLCIEIDGISHDMGNQPAFDLQRDAWLERNGIAVLRIPAMTILSDLDAAIAAITAAAAARLPLHHPAAPGGPPPRAKLGED